MRHALALTLLFCTMCTAETVKRRPRTMRMEATAFVLKSKPTSSGTVPHVGIVAADPGVLPMGTRIRITGAGTYDGVYTVTDTGAHMNGRRIDIYVSTAARAKRFGRKMVTVRILEVGKGREDAQEKDIPAKRRS